MITPSQLPAFIGKGFKDGYTNPDNTVSSLRYALEQLKQPKNSSGDTADTYARHAVSDLESRLFAGYILIALAGIERKDASGARLALTQAEKLVALSKQGDVQGRIPNLDESMVVESLALVERLLRDLETRNAG
jgi:hypothetical protein